jgi:signal transduction histidine kinase
METFSVDQLEHPIAVPNLRLSVALNRFRIDVPPLWLVVVLPMGYFAAAWVSISHFGVDTPIWVSNAFAVTALLRNRRQTWPVLLVLAAAADFTVIDLFEGGPLIALGVASCDSFEILSVASLSSLGGVARTNDIWSIARLALVCMLVPAVSAGGGAVLLRLAYGAPFLVSWKTWYLSVACGQLTVTPLLLSWTDQGLRANRSRGVLMQTILLAGLAAAIGYVDFNDPLPGLFFAFPFLLLAAFNGRLFGATTAAAALIAVAIWSTFAGHGPIAAYAGTNTVLKVQILQLYLMVVLLSTLPIAAVLEQRDKLTAQLRESTRAAQSAVRAKSEFVAVMSHEIRTPMTGVLGLADLLMNAGLPAKEQGYVAGIRASGRHLLALINDILDFSRIEAGKLELEVINFAIPEMLEQARSLLAPQADDRKLDLRFDLDAHSPPVVRGDPTRLKQVLVNLADNGLKFTNRGGVSVAVHRHTAGGAQERWRFEVRDTGFGIPEEKRAIVFDAFSQADSSMTRPIWWERARAGDL